MQDPQRAQGFLKVNANYSSAVHWRFLSKYYISITQRPILLKWLRFEKQTVLNYTAVIPKLRFHFPTTYSKP